MKKSFAILFALALTVLSFAQPATAAQKGRFNDKSYGTLHMRTNIGSAKFIDGVGRLELSFTGTLLISGYKGDAVVITGDVRKEYDGKGRTVYFGKGRAVFSGNWRGVQWFGRDFQSVWYGTGVVRIRGEFDKDLNTGEYWFNNPEEKQYWATQGTQDVRNPAWDSSSAPSAPPIRRDQTGKGKPTPPAKKQG